MFDGHQFVKVCNDWVFDITEFRGYKVVLNGDKVESHVPAFTVFDVDGELTFEKYIDIPSRVLNETRVIIEDYEKKALVDKENA